MPLSESVVKWLKSMQDSTDYLHIDRMRPGMAYTLWARNAYVGVWLPEEKGFLISHYKVYPTPFLSVEYHWDVGEPLGTAKPLRPLVKCPLPLPFWSDYRDDLSSELCGWLDTLEEHNPPLPGWGSVGERRQSAASFRKRRTRPSDL